MGSHRTGHDPDCEEEKSGHHTMIYPLFQAYPRFGHPAPPVETDHTRDRGDDKGTVPEEQVEEDNGSGKEDQ